MNKLPRLVEWSVAAKLTLTFFLLLIGGGYFVALLNIYYHHQDADLEPGLTIDDLRVVYHGMSKQVTKSRASRLPSNMEKMVRPGGAMREHLEEGGEPAIRTLMTWLENGAKEADFASSGLVKADDPSPQEVIAAHCVRCHNAKDGMESDVPYAQSAKDAPEYTLVFAEAKPKAGPAEAETQTIQLGPTATAKLVQITHAHILAMPVFALLVAGLFLLTGLPGWFKLIVGPAPILALCCDMASWWLARPYEPFIYVIAAAGGVFGVSLGAQMLCTLGSLWFGRRPSSAVR